MKKILETLRLKWAEYLLEIIVIIIGILGAFALNNWNDFRKLEKEENQLFSKILSDLRSDSIEIAERLTDYQKRQQLHMCFWVVL